MNMKRLFRKHRVAKAIIGFILFTSLSYLFLLLLLVVNTDNFGVRIHRSNIGELLDQQYRISSVFLDLQWHNIERQDDPVTALQAVNDIEQSTGNAYSIGLDCDLELGSNKLLWIRPVAPSISGNYDWITISAYFSLVVSGIRRSVIYQDLQRTISARKENVIEKTDVFQNIANSILNNNKHLKIVFLKDSFAFLKLAKETDILSIFWGWPRDREDLGEDIFGIRKMRQNYEGLLGNGRYRYFPCTVSGSHLSYSHPHKGKNRTCFGDLDKLASPSPSFEPRYFTYHALRHDLVVRSSKLRKRDVDVVEKEWQLSCAFCALWPHFVTYLHVIHNAVVGADGIVYTSDLKIMPLMWHEHKRVTDSEENNVGAAQGAYRYLHNDIVYTSAEALCPLGVKMRNLEANHVQTVEEVFSISVKFAYINFGHALLESLTRLSMCVQFLQTNPQIPIQVGNVAMLKYYLPIYGLTNNLLEGDIVAKRVYLPEGNPPYLPSVHYLQSTAYYVEQYIKTMPSGAYEKPRNLLIYVQRADRRHLKQDNIVTDLMSDLALRNGLEFQQFNGFSINSGDNANATMLLFHRAVLVFGAHGAGLSNILFSQPNTSVIEIQCPPPWTASTFRHVSYKLGMRFHSIMGHPIDGLDPITGKPSSVHCDSGLKIHNTDELRRTMAKMISLTLADLVH